MRMLIGYFQCNHLLYEWEVQMSKGHEKELLNDRNGYFYKKMLKLTQN